MPASRLLLSSALLTTTLLAPAHSPAGQLIVLGDSLSKEYQVTFLGIGGSPVAAHIRNWCEILDERRHDSFDMGSFSTFTDSRLTGHALNWSIPGSFASDWARNLATPGISSAALDSQLRSDDARVVIWLGGNDVRTKYEDLYNGKPADSWIHSVAFDLDPVRKDRHLLPQPWIENTGANGPRLALSWQPRDPTNSTWARITVQESSDLKSWSDVPPSATFNPGGGVRTVRRYPSPDGRTALRFSIQSLP